MVKMGANHLFSPPFTSHDGDIGTGVHRQSPSHLVANVGHVRVRLRGAEDDLLYRLRSTRKEHPPYQPPNLFACKVLPIPTVPFSRDSVPRQLRLLRRRVYQFGSPQHIRVCAHVISFRRITACPFLPVAKLRPEFPNTPTHLPVCAERGPGNPPRKLLPCP